MKKIAIVTDWSRDMGQGHIQRMASLTDYLNRSNLCSAVIITDRDMPPALSSPFIRTAMNVPEGTDLIIRDMRDSTAAEISLLKKIAPVMVIEDNGAGRNLADTAVDLLPNPVFPGGSEAYRPDAFIYGYAFRASLKTLEDRIFEKSVDLAVYTGHETDSTEFLPFIPQGITAVLLGGPHYQVIKDGKIAGQDRRSYGEILLSSRAVLSHFGLTLYEGFACATRLLSLNPSEYHSSLADQARELGIINMGLRESADPENVKRTITHITGEPLCKSISARQVLEKVESGLGNFSKLILQMI